MFRYYKLFDLLNRRGMKKMDLLNAGISAPTLAKLSKGEVVTTEMLDKICTFLECQPGDIMEHITEENIKTKNETKIINGTKKIIIELDEENEISVTEEKIQLRDKNDKLQVKHSNIKIE